MKSYGICFNSESALFADLWPTGYLGEAFGYLLLPDNKVPQRTCRCRSAKAIVFLIPLKEVEATLRFHLPKGTTSIFSYFPTKSLKCCTLLGLL